MAGGKNLREMLVHFLVVDNLALELLHHLLLRNTVVVNNRLLIHLKAVHLAGHGLEQGATSRAWSAQDDEHLATLHEHIEVAEDCLA